MEEDPDRPLGRDARFSVELARFVDGRDDPSTRVAPPGNADVDVVAMLLAEEQLARIVG